MSLSGERGSPTINLFVQQSQLEREKALAQEKLAETGKPKHTFEESFEHALRFLASPWQIWKNSDLLGRKTVLRLAFS